MTEKVLHILEEHRGKTISGSRIATLLGVSRTSVWKAINALREAGYTIDAGVNRGYRLCAEDNMLSAEGIGIHTGDLSPALHISCFDSLPSTNTYLRELANGGAPDWSVVIANEQTGGRGRLGKQFYSPKDTGIYMSVLLRPSLEMADAAFYTVMTAVAVRRAVMEYTKENITIKWINDLFSGKKKICGILTEGVCEMESSRIAYLIIGIGLNVSTRQFPSEIAETAGCVCDSAPPRNLLAAAILREMQSVFSMPRAQILAEYRNSSNLLGKPIHLHTAAEDFEGTAVSIDDTAHLVVRLADGSLRTFYSGEVSTRIAEREES